MHGLVCVRVCSLLNTYIPMYKYNIQTIPNPHTIHVQHIIFCLLLFSFLFVSNFIYIFFFSSVVRCLHSFIILYAWIRSMSLVCRCRYCCCYWFGTDFMSEYLKAHNIFHLIIVDKFIEIKSTTMFFFMGRSFALIFHLVLDRFYTM